VRGRSRVARWRIATIAASPSRRCTERPRRGRSRRASRPRDANAARTALADYVSRRIAISDGRRDAGVERCVDRLYASEGRVALAELCTLAGVGERQLQRRFAEVVGIAPRTLASIVRLRRVFDALRDAPWSTWSERAQAAGFFDHPQMARDFRRLLGRSPSEWAKRRGGIATSLVDIAG